MRGHSASRSSEVFGVPCTLSTRAKSDRTCAQYEDVLDGLQSAKDPYPGLAYVPANVSKDRGNVEFRASGSAAVALRGGELGQTSVGRKR